ncbi:MAG: site-specific integrase [bacterium]|nr:site-specific integrase [bacterium]
MAKVTLNLDRRNKPKKDGTYPLCLQLSHGKKTRYIGLRYSFVSENWDQENLSPINVPNAKHIGVKVRSQLSIAEQLIQGLEIQLDFLTIDELKARILAEIFSSSTTPESIKRRYTQRVVNRASLTDFAKEKMDRLTESRRFGSKSAVNTAYNSFKKYLGYNPDDNQENILFADVDLKVIKNFIAYLYSNDCSTSTARAYLAQIRALYNEAIEEGMIEESISPFKKGFKMPASRRSKKRALTIEQIEAIRKLDLEQGSYLWKARNYFLFMFNNFGLNFIDLVQLKKSQFSQIEYDQNGNLVAGRISYYREKTDRPFSIKLTSESIEILNHYDIGKKKSEDLIFPFAYENTEKGRKRYEQHRKTVNGHLKQIAQLAKIDENLTTYYARHSWATIGKRNNLPITLISEALGHADTKTTEIYLSSFDNDTLDAANELITKRGA